MVSLVPKGQCIDIVGIAASDKGRSCDVHPICGSQLIAGETVVRIREVKISINGKETALAVYTHSLKNDADGCCVGFL